ncbi:MAG TPA: flagellar basal body-associated FliL family protein [Alphaproteobacteria bacterium]|nr:flagellar basal body-associated FliL family protein [Alphaproteobacteria bacterium]
MTDQTMEAPVDAPVKVPRKGLSGKKLVLFIILPLVLLLGGGAVAYLLGVFTPKAAAPAAEATASVQPAVFYNLPDLLVNLNSDSRRTHFLKLSIAFELQSNEDAQTIQAVVPRIVDSFQVYLRELRIEDLQGAAGLQRLREELLLRVNAAAKPVKVKDVLFKEMLVQ